MARRGNTNIDVMRDEAPSAVQNNFTAGFKTEFTGLNFPQNAATDTENCIFTLTGDVTRRFGFDYESNYSLTTINRTSSAISAFRWLNVGGDGQTQIIVQQVGSIIYFYLSSSATTSRPISTQKLSSTVDLTKYIAAGSLQDPSTVECQYSSGNGYLFIYHPYCDPIYCTYTNGAVNGFSIIVQIRDFQGFTEPQTSVNFRSPSLTAEHEYNLLNQGWSSAPTWTTTSSSEITTYTDSTKTSLTIAMGVSVTFTVSGSLPITPGQAVNVSGQILATNTSSQNITGYVFAQGNVVSYSGTALVINFNQVTPFVTSIPFNTITSESWTISAANTTTLINSFHSALNVYPSNADIWWTFKDSTGAFNPAATNSEVVQASAQAANGHFILMAFNQQQAYVSGVSGLASVFTTARPKTGAWFQGRVWYAGVDANQPTNGDQQYYTWTENIYFSQVITDPTLFGMCYQANDPTDENLFGELPTDGGVIVIQGCGSIYKLFPIQNGMLVFAANGIWFITGSQGIGFAANDYVVTKISAVRAMSTNSFVDVNGLPMFWNEEGIYVVQPTQQGLGLQVLPVTVGTILSFYNSIPHDSKKYVKCDYNPITYVVQWLYRSTQETSVTDRYQYDSVLCFNTHTSAFYKYQLPAGVPYLHDVIYVANPGGSSAPAATFKYIVSASNGSGSYNFTFAEERDTSYTDFKSYNGTGTDFTSYFVTGYSVFGQGLRKFQCDYLNMYTRVPSQYILQSIWDFSTSGNSGRYSARQHFNNSQANYGMTYNRIKVRGHGVSLQVKVASVTGQPFDMMGWSMWITENASI